jgi:uncharacterized protein YdeI (BOF family)
MHLPKRIMFAPVLLAAMAALVAGCGMSSNQSAVTGSTFVVGTDAPMAAVTSFNVQINSITATDSNNNTVSLLSAPQTVDFARFNGLQTVLDLSAAPVGSYTSITVNLGSATIGYLNTATGGAPAIATMAATLTTSTITTTLSTPYVVSTSAPVGLHVDFDLADSIQVDASNQITGVVTPTFSISAVSPSDTGAYIDLFDAGVVSIDAANYAFVVQDRHGRQITVNVDSSTEWENSESISDLTTSSIVRLAGQIDSATLEFDADTVSILSQDKFFADGQITYTLPTTGAATSFDLYVRSLLPASTGLTLGQIATVDLTGSEKFFVGWMHNSNPFSHFLFNPYTLTPGQSVAIGGAVSGATNASAVTVNRISLHPSGFNGTITSIDDNSDTFQITVDGFAGVLINQAVTVYATSKTHFRHHCTSTSSLAVGDSVRVVGLLLKDPTTGAPAIIGRYVDNMSTSIQNQ